ncbi:MAG TPA: hypothetical protein VGF34_21085 [Stellaceae bacterium]|jgi:hypothetical protein
MVASPKLSPWFYEYSARNRRLHAREDQLPTVRRRQPERPPTTVKRRGAAPGTAPPRLTERQRQTIIGLIRQHPRRPSIVKEQFAQAWPGLTVSSVSIHHIKRKAVAAGKLQL